MLQTLKEASMIEVAIFFLIANVMIFSVSVVSCWLLGVMFPRRRIFERWEPVRRVELMAAGGAIVINAGISVLGWLLWSHDYISLHQHGIVRSVMDGVVMVLAMDLGMYVFHRLAHVPLLYRWIHSFHHRHEATNPLSLFVLHPIEVLGFGGLMIVFLLAYPMSITGLMLYLTFNVAFGTLGHCGVEPFPAICSKVPLLRWVGTSTFHAEHHDAPRYNFGFYTLIWDKLFGTIDPDYESHFKQGSIKRS